MPDVLLPFQALSDPAPSQGSDFTPQFPPQSLDLPSITISRNLVEQDGVLHSSGLHMVGAAFIVWQNFVCVSFVVIVGVKDLTIHILKHAFSCLLVNIWVIIYSSIEAEVQYWIYSWC